MMFVIFFYFFNLAHSQFRLVYFKAQNTQGDFCLKFLINNPRYFLPPSLFLKVRTFRLQTADQQFLSSDVTTYSLLKSEPCEHNFRISHYTRDETISIQMETRVFLESPEFDQMQFDAKTQLRSSEEIIPAKGGNFALFVYLTFQGESVLPRTTYLSIARAYETISIFNPQCMLMMSAETGEVKIFSLYEFEPASLNLLRRAAEIEIILRRVSDQKVRIVTYSTSMIECPTRENVGVFPTKVYADSVSERHTLTVRILYMNSTVNTYIFDYAALPNQMNWIASDDRLSSYWPPSIPMTVSDQNSGSKSDGINMTFDVVYGYYSCPGQSPVPSIRSFTQGSLVRYNAFWPFTSPDNPEVVIYRSLSHEEFQSKISGEQRVCY